jgi:hypothetical protein
VTTQFGDNSKCSRRSTPVQCNWLDRWASRAHRNARTRARRTWSDLWIADCDELTHTVFLTDLGEIPNWWALVNNLRHELVYWVRDYLAEPMAHSIYRARGGGPWIWDGAVATGEEEVTGANNSWTLPWQDLGRPMGYVLWLTATWWDGRRRVMTARNSGTTTRVMRPRHW